MNKSTLLIFAVSCLPLRARAQGLKGTACRRIVSEASQPGDCTLARFDAELEALGVDPGGVSVVGPAAAPPSSPAPAAAARGIAVPVDSDARCRGQVAYDFDSCERVRCQLGRLDEIKARHA